MQISEIDPMEVKIRPMEKKDVDAVYSLGIRSEELYSSGEGTWYPKPALKEWLKHKNDDILLVAEYNKKVAGFCLTYVHFRKWALLDSIVVDKKLRRKSIASELMKETFRIAKESGLVYAQGLVRDNNKKTLSFTKKLGMRKGNRFYIFDILFGENFKPIDLKQMRNSEH